jgi:hypothetical protein
LPDSLGHPLLFFALCADLSGCGGASTTSKPPAGSSMPSITSFAANPTSMASGSSSTLELGHQQRFGDFYFAG